MAQCRGYPECPYPIYWLLNDSTGDRAPVGQTVYDNGNVTVNLKAGTYHVLGADEPRTPPLYMSHFAECETPWVWRSRCGSCKQKKCENTPACKEWREKMRRKHIEAKARKAAAKAQESMF